MRTIKTIKAEAYLNPSLNCLNCWDGDGLPKDQYSSRVSLYLKGSQRGEDDDMLLWGP